MDDRKKKHILVISQCFYPEQFRINDIASEWVKRGYRVTAVTGIPNYPEGKYYPGYGLTKKRREIWNGIEIIHLPLIPRGHTSIGMVLNYLSFPVSEFFWKCFTKLTPDVIFMFETSPMTQCLLGVWMKKKLLKKGRSVKLLAYIQDLWPDNVEIVTGIHSPVVLKPLDKMVRKIYRHCDHIFATSPSFVEEIGKKVPPAERDKVHFWPQYAEDFYMPMDHFTAGCEDRADAGTAERLTSSTDRAGETEPFTVIFTGNIGYAQGLSILPETARILRDSGMDVRFVIVGDGRYRETLVKEIEEAGLAGSFAFTGRKPAAEIPALLASADAAFLSFMDNALFRKTIPAKLQSYMACAMPVIASADGETRRIIEEGGFGICAPLGDAEALADAVVRMKDRLAHDAKNVHRLSREYYEQHFDKKMLLDEMEHYLKSESV